MPDTAELDGIRTLDEFVLQLRALKTRTGNPSITEITRRVHRDWRREGRPRSELPARSTVGNCFQTGRRRPNPDLLLAVVRSLTGDDRAVVDAWSRALHHALGEAAAGPGVRVTDRLAPPPDGPLVHTAVLAEALRLADLPGSGRTVVLEGSAGTGKTTLAHALARRLATARRADGPLLVVDLHGTHPQAPPASPFTVLGHLLGALGVPPARVPSSTDGRSVLLRRLLAGSGTVLLLDDAYDAAQVRPLLPGPRAGHTLVTTRRLPAAWPELGGRVRVPPCDPADSLRVLRGMAGAARIDTDPRAARLIAEAVGHLPQALALVAHHVAAHPDWPLADYHEHVVASLVLRGGMGRSFAASERSVSPEARRLLRLLTLQPAAHAAHADVTAAARLAGTGPARARALLAELVAAALVEEVGPGLYALGRMVHAYARARLRLDEPVSRVQEALARLHRPPARSAQTVGN
ncbi:NACHT domain-containing protein [Streptomyces fradiae]|uniref:NACHT domain-containing protein n=1 Tax=Streptomyces fradiae TaxID=1906 RepID=UPI0035BE1BF7